MHTPTAQQMHTIISMYKFDMIQIFNGLQDNGILIGKRNKTKTVFRKLQASLLPVAKYIQEKFSFIDSNATRVAEKISVMANTMRNQHDKATLVPHLQQLIPEELKNNKYLYVVHNSSTAGIEQVVKNYLDKELATESKKAERRTPNDALRAVGICLLDKNRAAFNYWQQNKKTRFDLDLPVSLNDGFMTEAAQRFQ